MPQVPPNLAQQNERFLAAILRELLRNDRLPPRWTWHQMRAECRRLGLSA